jgi:hypothetical protein
MDHGCNYGLGERRDEEEAGLLDHQVVIVGTGEYSPSHRTAPLLSKGNGRSVQTSG